MAGVCESVDTVTDRIFDGADMDQQQNSHKGGPLTNSASTKINRLATSPRISSMIQDSIDIQFDAAKETGSLGFLNSMLVQATLPHSNPGSNVTYYERTSGVLTMSIMSRPSVGLPYGSLPRTLLAWICTEAVKTKSKTLYLGSSQAEFLRENLNLHTSGSYTSRVKEQAYRLFNSLITLENKQKDCTTIENTLIAKKAAFWNPNNNSDQNGAWQSELTLTTDFYEDVTSAPIPTDLRILHALKKSPLAMDIYTWLCYRQFLMSVKNDCIVRIPWEALRFQFGSNYSTGCEKKALHNFRQNFLLRLKEVSIFHPDLVPAVSMSTTKLFVMKKAKSMLKLKPLI